MLENNNNTKFYIFDCCNNVYIREFNSEDELIDFLGKSFYKCIDGSFYSKYLNNINMNGNDVRISPVFNENTDYVTRPFIFIDSDNRIIDARKYREEILKRINSGKYEHNFSKTEKNLHYGDVLCSWRGSFRYRIDPVPGTSSRHRYVYFLRFPRTSNEIKQNSIPSHKDFVRPSRRKLPTSWDDIPRYSQKSWKEQGKKRKQWM